MLPNRYGKIYFSTRDVWPVKEIKLENGKILKFPENGGTVTRQIQKIFLDYIDNHISDVKLQ